MIHKEVLSLLREISSIGGRGFLTGGWVRDYFLGFTNKDYDVEVYGLSSERLKKLLESIGNVDCVGESFAIYKFKYVGGENVIDVSLPRTERKQGLGHKGFIVNTNPKMSYAEACKRRDFTINAMLFDPLNAELIDLYGGLNDLHSKVIRHVSDETFVEDSLRIWRAIQFASRFNFTIAEETISLIKSVDSFDLPSERIVAELLKWLSSDYPNVGLELMFDFGFEKLGVKNPNRFVKWSDDALQNVNSLVARFVIFALILGEEQYLKFLDQYKIFTLAGENIRAKTVKILNCFGLYGYHFHASDVRELSTLCDIQIYHEVCKGLGLVETAEQIERLALENNCWHAPLKPLLTGQDLLHLGLSEGPQIGAVLKEVRELQFDGILSSREEALAFVVQNERC